MRFSAKAYPIIGLILLGYSSMNCFKERLFALSKCEQESQTSAKSSFDFFLGDVAVLIWHQRAPILWSLNLDFV